MGFAGLGGVQVNSGGVQHFLADSSRLWQFWLMSLFKESDIVWRSPRMGGGRVKSSIFAIYFAIKVVIKWWNFFTMEKVENPTVPKNNLFRQVYSITAFEVVFFHPLGLTE